MRPRSAWWLIPVLGIAAGFAVVALTGEPHVPAAPGSGRARTVEASADMAAATARAGGHPVEVASDRGERTTVYANPDGSFTREHYIEPQRTMRNGRWVPIDTTLVAQLDGTIAPKAATVDVRFSGGGDGALATMTRMGRTLRLTWPGPLPVPLVDGNRATYRDVRPDVDLVVNAEHSSFSHVLVVKTPAAARLLATLAYGVATSKLDLSVEAGGLIARDPGSRAVVFRAPPPTMWDAGAGANPGETVEPTRFAPESARTANVAVTVDGDRLLLTPDPKLLTDPAARYPLYIDPVWGPNTFLGGDFTLIDYGYQGNAYWQWSDRGNNVDQRVGNCPRDTSDCDSAQYTRVFFAIPTDAYMDDAMTILSATFHITLKRPENTGNAYATELWRTGGIGPGTTWSNQPGGSSWSGGTHLDTTSSLGAQACGLKDRNVSFNATAAIREANTNNWPVTTFGMKSNVEVVNGGYRAMRRFCHDAYVSVQYNKVPGKPANLTSNPGGGCGTGTSRPKVGSVPTLSAVLSDPDTTDGSGNPEAEPMWAQWTLEWTEGTTPKRQIWPADVGGGQDKPNGASFDYNLQQPYGVPNLPDGTVLKWRVRAWDGTAWGPDSDSCEFLLDKSRPAKGVDIDSPEYLPADAGETTSACAGDVQFRDGVGNYGVFTFDALDSDVVKYRYGFDGPATTDVPTSGGAPVTIDWMPTTKGDHWVEVIPFDEAWQGDPVTCHFNVTTGREPVAQWALDDPVGSTRAVDSRGAKHAAAGSGVSFGAVGPFGFAAAHLDGSASGYLTTSTLGLIATDRPFTVAAWAKLDTGASSTAIVSQDGTGESGMALGFDAGQQKWYLNLPRTDGVSMYHWTVYSAAAAQVGKWTLLVASYDPHRRELKLEIQVDGVDAAPVVAAHRSRWAAHGNLHIGRRYTRTGYGHPWRGDLADVTVYDRITPLREISPQINAKRIGYWDFDQLAAGGTRTREYAEQQANPATDAGDGKALTLNGATWMQTREQQSPFDPPGYQALMGAGDIVFDAGEGDYLDSPARLIGLRTSFSVAARVRLVGACTEEQVIVSQPGTNRSRFKVRCLGGRYELVMTNSDGAGATETVLRGIAGQADYAEGGHHLAVTFNAVDNAVRLYVNGQLATTATGAAIWNGSLDGLQVGRGLLADGGGYGAYLSGAADEVRVYQGVLTQTQVRQIAGGVALPDL